MAEMDLKKIDVLRAELKLDQQHTHKGKVPTRKAVNG